MAQIRKYQNAGKIEEPNKTYQKINVDGLGEFDPEELRTRLAQDPDKWFTATGADAKHRSAVITRIGEILDMSKQYGVKVDPAGTYTFNNPLNGEIGVNDKFKSSGKFQKKGIFGLGGIKDNDNTINNLAYYAIDKMIRGDQSNPTSGEANADYLSQIDAELQAAQQAPAAAATTYKTGMGAVDWNNFVRNGIFNGSEVNLENFRKAYATDPERYAKVKSLLDKELVNYNNPEWDSKYKWTGPGTKDEYVSKLQNLNNSLAGNAYNDDVYKSLFESGTVEHLQPFLDNTYGLPAVDPLTPTALDTQIAEEEQQVVPPATTTTPEITSPVASTPTQGSVTIGDIMDDNTELSDVDMLDISSVTADLIGIATGFVPVPGASIGSAAIGAGGSLTQFAADWKRDGFDGWDVGHLAMNLGLDAISLIPFASGAKLAAKTPKLIKAIPTITKLAMAAGAVGAAGTLKKMGEILVDPNRSLKELDMQDVRNLGMIGSLGLARKNALANKKVKEVQNTFEVVSPATKAKTKVEITEAELKELNKKKSVSEKESYLNEVVAQRVEEGKLAPELKNAEPVVDRFKLKVWESSPIKGTAVTSKKVEGTGFKHNLNDESAWSRYLAKTREVSTRNPFKKGDNNNPPSATAPTPEATKAKRTEISTRIIDTRKQIAETETQLNDIKKQIETEVHNTGKADYNNKMNTLASREVTLQTKLDNLQNKLDVDVKAHADLAPKKNTDELNQKGQSAINEARKRISQKKADEATKNFMEGIPKNRERAEVQAQQEKLDKEFLNRIKTGASARAYKKTGSMFGGNLKKPKNTGSSYTPSPLQPGSNNMLQRTIPFENPNLPSGLYGGTWYHKKGGKVIKAQDGLSTSRIAQIPRYSEFGVQYQNNYKDYDHQSQLANGAYGSDTDFEERLNFLRQNLPESVMASLGAAGGWKNPANVKQYQTGYNNYVDATATHFIKRGWGNAQDIEAYQNAQKFTSPESGNTASSVDGKFGLHASTRAAFQKAIVTPEQLEKLKAIGITRAQQVLTNPQAKAILGEETFNNITKDLGTDADYVLGAVSNQAGEILPDTLTRTDSSGTVTTPVATPVATARAAQIAAKTPGDNNGKWDPVPIAKALEATLGIVGNNSLKAPVKTGFIDPLALFSPVYGDLQTRSMYNNQASKTRSWANKATTSDASLHAAKQLEAETQANNLTEKGWLVDSNTIKQTGDRALALQIESERSRNQAANYNKSIMDENNIARTTLQNQKNLANFGIMQNVAKEAKNELMADRADVRDAEIQNTYMQNQLDYKAKQNQLDMDYQNRNTNVYKYNQNNALMQQKIAALDTKATDYTEKLKEYNDRIAQNKNLIKGEENYLYGGEAGGNNYYSNIINANKNLSTSNLNSYRKVKSDNRYVKSGPYGYFGLFKSGGSLDVLTTNSSSRENSNQTIMDRIVKTYKDIIKKFK